MKSPATACVAVTPNLVAYCRTSLLLSSQVRSWPM